jgi:hypothetical protein
MGLHRDNEMLGMNGYNEKVLKQKSDSRSLFVIGIRISSKSQAIIVCSSSNRAYSSISLVVVDEQLGVMGMTYGDV